MPDPDFFNFMLEDGYDLIFDDEEEFECPHCGYMITPEDNIEVTGEGQFKCPECGEDAEIRN